MSRFVQRMIGAARLDAAAYEEVEADRSANAQAFAVVALSGVALGIGGLANSGWHGIPLQAAAAIVLWLAWAAATYWVGTRLLPGARTAADVGQLLRTIGFSSAPGMLRVLMLIPGAALGVLVVCTLWELVAMVVAVRQALDYHGTARAVAVCAIPFPLYVLTLFTSILALGPWPL
jgi:hypothetical protein